MRKAENELSGFLRSHAVFLDKAYFTGILYNLGDYPGAITCCEDTDRVYGNVFQLNDEEEVFSVLDEYEEAGPEFASPNLYRREKVNAFIADNIRISCWVYLYNRPVKGLVRISSGDYTDFLQKGH